MSSLRESRTILGAGEKWLAGLDSAAGAWNVSVQLCGANGADLLLSMGLPHVTQARSSIDYALAFDIPDASMSGLPHCVIELGERDFS